MNVHVKSWSTAGAALLTAGALTIAPLNAPVPAAMQPAAITQQISHRIELELAAATGPLEAAGEIIQGLLVSTQRAVTSVIGIPASLLNLVNTIATGTEAQVMALVNDAIAKPLWVVDPTLIASNDALPASIGQGNDPLTGATNSLIASLRNLVLAPATNLVQGLADAAIHVGYGAVKSLQNAIEYLRGTPAGLVPIVQAFFAGDKVGLYNAILPFTTGITWMVDPVLYALNAVLPAPFGGVVGPFETNTASWVASFRYNVVWTASRLTNVVIAAILGLPGPAPDSQGDPIPTAAMSPTAAVSAAATAAAAGTKALTVGDTPVLKNRKDRQRADHKARPAGTAAAPAAASAAAAKSDNTGVRVTRQQNTKNDTHPSKANRHGGKRHAHH